MYSDKPRLVIVLGPTAVGKSGVAVALAKRFCGEIINGDAFQVYRGVSIGTDKPSPEDRAGILHHLLDIVDPETQFCAMDFVRETLKVLASLRRRKTLPIIVGGTGLYLKALLEGLFPGPGRDPDLRHRLEEEASRDGLDALWRRLDQVDRDYARKTGRGDRVRIIRALEVFESTKIPLSRHFLKTRGFLDDFHCLRIGLQLERKILYERIEARVDRMFERGLVGEVEALLRQGVGENAPAFHAIGYSHVLRLIKGEVSLEDAIRLTKTDTRHLAKRQMTWFRKMPGITWFSPLDIRAIADHVRARL